MTGETITLDDIDIADVRYAVLALDKHANHREQEGHGAAARKYRDAADEFRRRADQIIEGDLFGGQDEDDVLVVLPPDIEAFIDRTVEKKFAEHDKKREHSIPETSIER